jgi:hypothetical protein
VDDGSVEELLVIGDFSRSISRISLFIEDYQFSKSRTGSRDSLMQPKGKNGIPPGSEYFQALSPAAAAERGR